MSIAKLSTVYKGLILDLPLTTQYYNANTNIFKDRTPYRNHGTNVSGSVGENYTELSNQYISFTSSLLPESTNFSLCFWYNPKDSYNYGNYFWSQYTSGISGRFLLFLNSNGTLQFSHTGANQPSTFTFDLNLFSFITVIKNSNNIILYKNTSSESPFIDNANILQVNSLIGRQHIGGGNDSQGYFANYKIWNRSITQQEIEYIFNKERIIFGV